MTFKIMIDNLIKIIELFVPVLIGAAVIVFLYGLFGYMTSAGDESKRTESAQYIFYGIIGLFVMISLWSLAFLFTDFFGFNFGIPQIQ